MPSLRAMVNVIDVSLSALSTPSAVTYTEASATAALPVGDGVTAAYDEPAPLTFMSSSLMQLTRAVQPSQAAAYRHSMPTDREPSSAVE